MVKQGDIIKLNFNPQSGHEQAGFRPAVVISNDFFNEKVNMTIVSPITNSNRSFPLHVPLDDRTKTTGFVLCEHIKSIDLEARSYNYVEAIPKDLLERIISIIFSEIETI
ncbi:MAG: type II toxin-antitoxin system PemK/MazF family toxin [Acetobacterium sp.]|uniref:type II toxin-antitoxin system PemK/MazF family toxin n=1 Tax=Acetobacterium sp. TaxID=1872094 RepID=UPI003242B9EB